MANINKIRLSGQTYNIEDVNASKTVELTQAQYDALTVKDPNTFYVITDAQGADLSNYYTKSETSGATQISTALNAKQDTLVSGTNIKTINNESILGSGNINIQGGGGKAIEAGRGITVTTGATADTVSVDLPISGDSKSNVYLGRSANYQNRYGSINFIAGSSNDIGSFSNQINYCTVFGWNNRLKNDYEFGCGIYNTSNTGSTNADKTLFSVGNGTFSAKHNAFEIRQNGDIYCSDGTNDVKLQDTITATAANTTALGGKVDTSAITTSISSSSTDAQVPSAKAVYDTIGNINTILESI